MTLLWAYLVAALLGALVGMVEIMQRYRAEPFAAMNNRWGISYVVFNGAVALAGLYVVVLSEQLTAATAPADMLGWAAAAGFGSAALLRAKLMNVQLSEGKEVALGPELLVQTFLSAIDSQIDRHQGARRSKTVSQLFGEVDFEKAKVRLPIFIFQALQTVKEEDTQRLMQRVAEVDAMETLPAPDKALQLGFYLLDLVGEAFLTDVMTQHGAAFKRDPP